ncbi:hypothetical protein LTR10_014441 [Elasticomyces elasticus]|nr:hypothetical protein LTR10_014441 [Elasticomyces elasticus]KAK5029645.1 hypothetical protein LTR13_008565 [Exophiala sideris]
MPFVNGLSRKRRPTSPPPASSPARSVSSPVSKIPKLNHLLYDGTNSRSIESTSTGRSKVSVKSQLKRGVFNIKTILGIGGRHDDADLQHHSEAVFTSNHGSQLGYILQNDSNATTLYHPLRIRLTAVDEAPGEHMQSEALSTVRSAPLTPEPVEHDTLMPIEWPGFSKDFRRTIRRSQSLPGLQQRISQKFHQAFGKPTVVRRSELRSRPSLQTFANDATEPTSAPLSSAPSTVNSGTGTPYNRATSTPLTSMSVTPTSLARRDNMNSFDIDNQTYFAESRLLTPIPETAALPTLTIKTVEAAAAAKVFFEMHFNILLNDIPARALRRRELEIRILEHHLPMGSQYRARKAWARAESDNLRQSRVLKNSTNHEKASQGITIGGFEVINVLGKGSFGVVRLIRGKGNKDKNADEEAVERNKTPHLNSSASSSKLASRAPGGLILNKRKELAKARQEVFAMKVIRKSDMLRNGQEGHLRAERDFLVAAEGSRWVIPLIAAFQDHKHLYLVMEYCIGGDFLGLLIRKNVLSEEITKWYIAEMVLCVEEAHRMKWIHRDVKPDNFLISVDGHLKISDFGLAFDGEWCHDQGFYHESRHSLLSHLGLDVEGDEQDRRENEQKGLKDSARCTTSKTSHRTSFIASNSRDEPMIGEPIVDWRNRCQRRRLARSVVGTSQYMSPEWSLAIIMYECLYGYTPFACEDRHQTKLKILQHRKTLVFPQTEGIKEPSIEALDLMMQLLVEKERRLCSRQYELNDFSRKLVGGRLVRCAADKSNQNYQGYFVYPGDAEDIKRHPFFKNIEWHTVHQRRPPYLPRVKDWVDTKYFDEEEPISDIDTATTIDEANFAFDPAMGEQTTCLNELQPLLSSPRVSQHHHEDQHIVPSMAIHAPRKDSAPPGLTSPSPDSMNDMRNPLLQPAKHGDFGANGCMTAEDVHPGNGGQVDGPKHDAYNENTKPKSKKKEKKRPRDIILRDASAGHEALEIRKQTAFLGYDYRQPVMVKEIIDQVLAEDVADRRLMDGRPGMEDEDRDLNYEKRVFVDAGGQLAPFQKPTTML